MANIVSNDQLSEAFAMAVSERSRGYADLVADSNVITKVMKANDGWVPFDGGPSIRETLLFAQSGTYTRYAGADTLNIAATEQFNDAEFLAKQAAVAVVLTGEDQLKNSGKNQLRDLFKAKIKAGEQELLDGFTTDLHSDGTADSGKQIGGFQLALPTTPSSSGTYGGIDRNTVAAWRTGAHTGSSTVGASLTAANIHDAYTVVAISCMVGTRGPNLIAASSEHYRMFQQGLVAHQRVGTEDKDDPVYGFANLKFAAAGKSLSVVLEGGQGTAMPSGTTYFLKLGDDGFKVRMHSARDMVAFGGKRVPIDQDAIVQMIGFYGNLTLANPRYQAKLTT